MASVANFLWALITQESFPVILMQLHLVFDIKKSQLLLICYHFDKVDDTY